MTYFHDEPQPTEPAHENPPYPEGWGWPTNARKPHYFVQHSALCGKWIYMGELGSEFVADGCVPCSRLLARRRSAGAQ